MLTTALKKSDSAVPKEQDNRENTVTRREGVPDNKEAEEDKEEPEVYSDFQMTLQKNTRTMSQVIDEENKKLIEEIKERVPKGYEQIKNELLEKAENGRYHMENGRKTVTVDSDYFSYFIHKCTYVRGKCLDNTTRGFINGPYNLKCTVTNKVVYEALLDELNKYADADNVKLKIILKNKEPVVPSGWNYPEYDIPCDVRCGRFVNRYKFLVRATVRY